MKRRAVLHRPHLALRPSFPPSPLHRCSGVADLFLDTPLCNAHTTGCDVLWGGCPMVTLPLERFASRVAASLCHATGLGEEMVVSSQQEYEERVSRGGGQAGGGARGRGGFTAGGGRSPLLCTLTLRQADEFSVHASAGAGPPLCNPCALQAVALASQRACLPAAPHPPHPPHPTALCSPHAGRRAGPRRRQTRLAARPPGVDAPHLPALRHRRLGGRL